MWGLDGHSGKETPGLIPNPEVKLIYVILSTMVREPMGKIPLYGGLGLWLRRRAFVVLRGNNGKLCCLKAVESMVRCQALSSSSCFFPLFFLYLLFYLSMLFLSCVSWNRNQVNTF